MRNIFKLCLLLFIFTSTTVSMRAQDPVPPPAPANQPLSDAQLDQMLGPIALYPDPLIAEILPASTFPTQIVLADRYTTGGGDPNQISQQPWDASVQAVARYPSVLKWMDDNLSETTALGQAFINQQSAVMASIQRLRASASSLGNLQTTSQQDVTTDGNDIEIEPANDQEMYVPDYQSDQVYCDQGVSGVMTISFIGTKGIHVPPTGGINREVKGIRPIRQRGITAVGRMRPLLIVATEAGRRKRHHRR
jgi:hypothetical protein